MRRPAVRTRLVRVALAAGALAAAVAALVFALRDPPEAAPLLPEGSDGIVVLDLSASVSASVNRRLASTLDRLAESEARVGLVLFSDRGAEYLALPPGSPAAELRPFARFFRVPRPSGGSLPRPPSSPWSRQYSAGTEISTGLGLALALALEPGAGRPEVLLVSDLDDSTSDAGRLAAVVLEYRRAGVPLRVVALDPAPEDRSTFEALLARADTITVAPDPAVAAVPGGQARAWAPIAAAALAGVLLAALLAAGARLRWREAA